MKKYKKKTIALILASMITIAGTYAVENFKNTLLGIGFHIDNHNSNSLNINIQTKSLYKGSITPTKKDNNTYILVLPEIDSKMKTPDLTNYNGLIESVSINTLPYTTNGNGYTKIVIKTNDISYVRCTNTLYMPPKKNEIPDKQSIDTKKDIENSQKNIEEVSQNLVQQDRLNETEYYEQDNVVNNEVTEKQPVQESINSVNDPIVTVKQEEEKSEPKSEELLYLVLGIFVVIISSIYFYKKAKEKLVDVVGEKLVIEIDDEKEKKEKNKKKEIKKIRKTIKELDKQYKNSTYSSPLKKEVESSSISKTNESYNEKEEVVEEELNVVDLDEIFKEKKNSDISNNDINEDDLSLEDFLNELSFGAEENEIIEENDYDKEYYDEVLKSEDIVFSNHDIECMNKLLNLEITDLTLNEWENYLISNPIKKKRSKKEILEEFVMTYTISQNITFTNEDIKALDKLINVELDMSFINDLRTKPERVQEMQLEIEKFNKTTKKPSEIKILNVKDMLPNLSEELSKQGNKQIDNRINREILNYNKNLNIKTLLINDKLPDLSKEINNKDAYISKPSAEYQIIDNSYEVPTLTIAEDMPDLKDVLIHPEKYEEKKEEKIVDEKSLLNNLSNPTFKPFYDETQNIEILNEDIKADKEFEKAIEIKEDDEKLLKLDRNIAKSVVKNHRNIRPEILEKISNRREGNISKLNTDIVQADSKEIKNNIVQDIDKKCISDGISYDVISSVSLSKETGCYLTKNEGKYIIFGYIKNKTYKIKEYEELKSEKIQARKQEELENGDIRYLIRIGINKFVVIANSEKIEYVMDLC